MPSSNFFSTLPPEIIRRVLHRASKELNGDLFISVNPLREEALQLSFSRLEIKSSRHIKFLPHCQTITLGIECTSTEGMILMFRNFGSFIQELKIDLIGSESFNSCFLNRIWSAILKECKNVTDISLNFLYGTKEYKEFIATFIDQQAPLLTKLDLLGEYLPFETLKKCINLRKISLQQLVDSDIWKFIGAHLECISLYPSPTADIMDDILRYCPCLTHVEFEFDYDDEDEDTEADYLNFLCAIGPRLIYVQSFEEFLDHQLEPIVNACPNLAAKYFGPDASDVDFERLKLLGPVLREVYYETSEDDDPFLTVNPDTYNDDDLYLMESNEVKQEVEKFSEALTFTKRLHTLKVCTRNRLSLRCPPTTPLSFDDSMVYLKVLSLAGCVPCNDLPQLIEHTPNLEELVFYSADKLLNNPFNQMVKALKHLEKVLLSEQ